MISLRGMTRPNTASWRAICSARALEDSNAVNIDTFICALARASSVSSRFCVACARQSKLDRDELGKLAPAARGIKAEQAGVGIGPVEGMDRIGEAALLAHFLEQARGHAAADDIGEDMRGILILIGVGHALEADDDMSLLEAPLQR